MCDERLLKFDLRALIRGTQPMNLKVLKLPCFEPQFLQAEKAIKTPILALHWPFTGPSLALHLLHLSRNGSRSCEEQLPANTY